LYQRDDRYRADGDAAPLGERDAARLARVREAITKGGYSPPNVRELDAELAMGGALTEILAALTAEGELVKVAADFYYPRTRLEAMATGLHGFFAERNEMRVADLKDLFGISRKHAVPVLEYFDRLGVTRRLGDVRVAGRLLSAGDGGAS
ncbi:MAG: selenocysteine-specific elongation factor, partial [bacterium]